MNSKMEEDNVVELRLPGGMQAFVERSVTDGKEAEHSSIDDDSECSDRNQHNVWNLLLCTGRALLHQALRPRESQ